MTRKLIASLAAALLTLAAIAATTPAANAKDITWGKHAKDITWG